LGHVVTINFKTYFFIILSYVFISCQNFDNHSEYVDNVFFKEFETIECEITEQTTGNRFTLTNINDTGDYTYNNRMELSSPWNYYWIITESDDDWEWVEIDQWGNGYHLLGTFEIKLFHNENLVYDYGTIEIRNGYPSNCCLFDFGIDPENEIQESEYFFNNSNCYTFRLLDTSDNKLYITDNFNLRE